MDKVRENAHTSADMRASPVGWLAVEDAPEQSICGSKCIDHDHLHRRPVEVWLVCWRGGGSVGSAHA
jgi:hypothetical protein